jgi:hypothetical protein
VNQQSQCIGVRATAVGPGIVAPPGWTGRHASWAGGVLLACCVAATPAWAHSVPATEVSAGALSAEVGHDPMPDPGLAPDDVVGIVLRALQHNDDPVTDHGIAITFAFTSPENHDITGPLERFRALVKSPAYRLMIGHSRAERGPVAVTADHARERVAITGANGDRAVYVFLLSRQELGSHKGCWMADGVLRETDPVAADRSHRSMLTPIGLPHD